MKAAAIAAALIFGSICLAQISAAPSFDVVSIKPADPLQRSSVDRMHPGWYELRNLTVVDLVALGWRVERYQVTGASGWQTTAGWDIDARFPAGTDGFRIPLMIQSMLADRFHLQARLISGEASVYRLLVAKGGTKMPETKEPEGGMSSGQTSISFDSVDMADFAAFLSIYLKRKVIDATGLTARYRIDLRFSPMSFDPSGDPDTRESSIFSAMPQQLGLRMETSRAIQPAVLIESVEKPSPN